MFRFEQQPLKMSVHVPALSHWTLQPALAHRLLKPEY